MKKIKEKNKINTTLPKETQLFYLKLMFSKRRFEFLDCIT